MRVNWTVMGMGCLLLWCASPATLHATDPHQEPTSEFLEFLGSWETDDGEWIDPMELLDPAWGIHNPTQDYEDLDSDRFWPFSDEREQQGEELSPSPQEGGGHE